MNFAVAGATALDNDFFERRGLEVTWTNYSLSVQIEWFKKLLPSICSPHSFDCRDFLSKSLFLVGEIGGNDCNGPFFQGWKLDEILTFVPKIIHKISSTIDELIELGARTLLVPGNFPIGCSPGYLSKFQNSLVEDYDPHTGCIKWLNDFAAYQNSKLLQGLDQLRKRHPYATIIYADYYNAAMGIYNSSNPFGFGTAPLAACCGSGGPYNFNSSGLCGTKTATTVCSDPSRFSSWDGVHFTEAAYRIIATGLLNGSFTVPPINRICPTLEQKMMQA